MLLHWYNEQNYSVYIKKNSAPTFLTLPIAVHT